MAIRHIEKVPRRFCEPAVSGTGLTSWTVAIAAGVKSQRSIRALVTLFHACSAGGGSTGADVSEYLTLLCGEGASPSREELLFMLAKDICNFHTEPAHFCRPSS